MKKYYFLFIIFCCVYSLSYAHHLKGGWVYYEYLGQGSSPNTSSYRITVKQYLNCQSTSGQIDKQIYIGVFDAGTNQQYGADLVIGLDKQVKERLDTAILNPCINPKPDPNDVCYYIDSYTTKIDLPDNIAGYVLAVQRCCRIDNIVNVKDDDVNGVGITYTTTIPGELNGLAVRNNNSPVFAQNDLAVICINSSFNFDFSATDIDNDSLVYAFCSGLGGANISTPGPGPAANPPYFSIKYNSPFTGLQPLGSGVIINSKTGIISGTAPGIAGTYVVAVQALEYRNGILIGSTRKEIHINVSNCSLNAAQLKPDYITCDGFSFTFLNESANNNISSYLWDFGVGSISTDTSTKISPTYTYTDTGAYRISLHVSNIQGCKDSAKSTLYVYPGFIPNFIIKGNCYLNAYQFVDSTTTKYGVVNNWLWNFGDKTTDTDTAVTQYPQYIYPEPGSATVSLVVSNSKGCTDTIYKTFNILDKPLITFPFTDSLICEKDSLQLHAYATGNNAQYTWKPLYNIINANSDAPIVYPLDTTTYILTVNENGCINSDSVKVNVINQVFVDIKPDTVICKADSIRLSPVSNATSFTWSPATGLSDPNIQNPYAFPLSTTTYTLLAKVGKCFAVDSKTISVVPYPFVKINGDTSICFGNSVKLNAVIQASSFTWFPASSLLNANTLSPIAGPQSTIQYVLTVSDTLGCPKSSSDTVLVKVIPKINAFAGDDTMIVANQPLQLNASGGVTYLWSPSTGISDPNIASPVLILNEGFDTMVYVVTVNVPPNCAAKDSLKVIVFKTQPGIFIPTGFTPNNDGKNDILRPVLVGMKQLDFFRIYNRWGSLLYSTSRIGEGWDGTLNGIKQPAGTYVFIAEAVNYLGRTIMQKGTVVLIR